nr:2B [mischivirus A1]
PGSLVEAALKDISEEITKLPEEESKGLKKTFKEIRDSASKLTKRLKPKKDREPKIEPEVECAFLAFLEAEDPIETMAKGWNAISEIQRLWASVKRVLSDSSFWYDLLVMIIKYIISTMIWILNPTTSVTLGLAAMAALDFLSMKGLKTKILDYLTPKLGPPPPIPDGLFSEPPSAFTKAKAFFGMKDETPLEDQA